MNKCPSCEKEYEDLTFHTCPGETEDKPQVCPVHGRDMADRGYCLDCRIDVETGKTEATPEGQISKQEADKQPVPDLPELGSLGDNSMGFGSCTNEEAEDILYFGPSKCEDTKETLDKALQGIAGLTGDQIKKALPGILLSLPEDTRERVIVRVYNDGVDKAPYRIRMMDMKFQVMWEEREIEDNPIESLKTRKLHNCQGEVVIATIEDWTLPTAKAPETSRKDRIAEDEAENKKEWKEALSRQEREQGYTEAALASIIKQNKRIEAKLNAVIEILGMANEKDSVSYKQLSAKLDTLLERGMQYCDSSGNPISKQEAEWKYIPANFPNDKKFGGIRSDSKPHPGALGAFKKLIKALNPRSSGK